MCDYSLHNVRSRSAKVGDKLVTTRFEGASTRGFSAVGESGVAVCLRPGTEIAFEKNVEAEIGQGVFKNKSVSERTATFRQINMNDPAVHHDALEFPNGMCILLTKLGIGQHATVLQLPAEAKKATEETGHRLGTGSGAPRQLERA